LQNIKNSRDNCSVAREVSQDGTITAPGLKPSTVSKNTNWASAELKTMQTILECK
jgi:hypothetical protein